jgi:hypothetical protein
MKFRTLGKAKATVSDNAENKKNNTAEKIRGGEVDAVDALGHAGPRADGNKRARQHTNHLSEPASVLTR